MFKLVLYKEQDPAQPLTVTAPSGDGVLECVQDWTSRNYPSGLTLPVDDPEYPHEVVLFWYAGRWFIAWDSDTERKFPTFSHAVKAFIDACYHQVQSEEDDDDEYLDN